MSDWLYGRALVWSCFDPSGVVLAAARSILSRRLEDASIRPVLLPIALSLPEDEARGASSVDVGDTREAIPYAARSGSRTLGLTIWRWQEIGQLSSIGLAVAECRRRHQSTVCVVYCERRWWHYVPILCESGAQVIVSDVPSLQRALTGLLPRVPLSRLGYHPLTSGLVDRLPWSDWEAD